MVLNEDALKLSQFVRAPREKVFEAWTRSEQVKQWLCPEDCEVISNEADLRVGGTYRETMNCNGQLYTVQGTYQSMVPNEKLVFTHKWEGENSLETLVTVEFKDNKSGTEVTLTQTGFSDASVAKGHEDGWASALRNLAKLIAKSN